MSNDPSFDGSGGNSSGSTSNSLSVWSFLRFDSYSDFIIQIFFTSDTPLRDVLTSIKASKLGKTLAGGLILTVFSVLAGGIQAFFAAIGGAIDALANFVLALIGTVASFPITFFGARFVQPKAGPIPVFRPGPAFQPLLDFSAQFPTAGFVVVVAGVGIMMFVVGELIEAFRGAA